MKEKEHIEHDILQNKRLKENPYFVPKDYFISVEKEITDKISNIVKEERLVNEEASRIPTSVKLLKSMLGLAASFILIFGLGYGVMRITTSNYLNEEKSLSQNDTISLTDEYELLNTTLKNHQLEDALQIISEEPIQISNEDIEDYLINSDISELSLASLE